MVKNRFYTTEYDAVVVGAGHAGCEAALALARTGIKTVMLTLNLDSIAFMACNPSIGGTAKGHLVREIDALGGEMGVNADKTALQIRMLNVGKGAAVQSLRSQADKNAYHTQMKKTLEHTENLSILQGEAAEILTENGKVTGVRTAVGEILTAKAVILATGVYLKGEIVVGETKQSSGPNGFAPANLLTENLISLGFKVRRFKTGTPARVDGAPSIFPNAKNRTGKRIFIPFPIFRTAFRKNRRPAISPTPTKRRTRSSAPICTARPYTAASSRARGRATALPSRTKWCVLPIRSATRYFWNPNRRTPRKCTCRACPLRCRTTYSGICTAPWRGWNT